MDGCHPSPAAYTPARTELEGPMGSIADALQTLERLAGEHGLSLRLRPPATADAIADAEKALGRPLPAEYAELLAVADGQEEDASFPWMPGCDRLQPIASCVSQLKDERGMTEDFPPPDHEDLEGWIRGGRYHLNRFPIAGSTYWDGDTTYLDLEPGSAGKQGQLITLTSECDFVVLGENLGHAFRRYLACLASGDLVWNAEEKTLVAKGEEPHASHVADDFALVR